MTTRLWKTGAGADRRIKATSIIITPMNTVLTRWTHRGGGMEVFDNVNKIVKNDLEITIDKGSKLSIATACFSIYAYQALKKQLDKIKELRFIFTSPAFVSEKAPKEKREFYIPRLNGCILADSVGLGKTFTALAVIKYYENRNRSVLVLCPKKLSDNSRNC
jgi:hypothetical protein